MTQKPLLSIKAGAHAARKRSERNGGGVDKAQLSRGACVCALSLNFEASLEASGCLASSAF
jgi:hypothetical protein